MNRITPLVVLFALNKPACGGGGGNVPLDEKGQDAGTPSWCSPLTAMQTDWVARDHLDPIVACEERYYKQPVSAYLCETMNNAQASCLGFVSDNVTNDGLGIFVYCCF